MSSLRNNEIKILRSLAIFPYLLGTQITQLLYSKNSQKLVSFLLKKLYEERYIQRERLATASHSIPYLYSLAAKGRHYMQHVGYDFSTWLPVAEMKIGDSPHRWHLLAVNDFLIAAVNLANTHPNISLKEVIHDYNLWSYMRDDTFNQRKSTVRPDGFLRFHLITPDGTYEQCMFLELDTGLIKQKKIKEKIANLCTYIQTRYGDDFESDKESLTVVFATTQDEKRVLELVHWYEEELAETQWEEMRDTFRFASINTWSPEQLFLSPIWRTPFMQDNLSSLML